jgi:hypothetical protein
MRLTHAEVDDALIAAAVSVAVHRFHGQIEAIISIARRIRKALER